MSFNDTPWIDIFLTSMLAKGYVSSRDGKVQKPSHYIYLRVTTILTWHCKHELVFFSKELIGEYFHSVLIVEGVYIYIEFKIKEKMIFHIFCLLFSFSLVNAN